MAASVSVLSPQKTHAVNRKILWSFWEVHVLHLGNEVVPEAGREK